jgi:hypothetical protein
MDPRTRTQSSVRLPTADQARLTRQLCDLGISWQGAQQALGGLVITNETDRARIATLLARLAAAPGTARLEVFDYPGFYAQRYDGVDKGK